MPKKSQDVQTESANGAPRIRKAAAKKVPAKKTRVRKKAPAKTSFAAKPVPPTDEQIRLRAYFIGEQRALKSIAGDHNSDWLEARRQLFEEAGLPLL